jgi:hypothetical protein
MRDAVGVERDKADPPTNELRLHRAEALLVAGVEHHVDRVREATMLACLKERRTRV